MGHVRHAANTEPENTESGINVKMEHRSHFVQTFGNSSISEMGQIGHFAEKLYLLIANSLDQGTLETF